MNNYVSSDAKEKLIDAIYTDKKYFGEEQQLDDLIKEESASTMSYLTEDDLKPTQTTLDYKGEKHRYTQFVYENEYLKEETRSKYKISAKGKVLIAVYVLLVVMIFAFIAFNAKYLRGLDKKIDTANEEVAQLKYEVDNLVNELKIESSRETIIEKAKELGMVER